MASPEEHPLFRSLVDTISELTDQVGKQEAQQIVRAAMRHAHRAEPQPEPSAPTLPATELRIAEPGEFPPDEATIKLMTQLVHRLGGSYVSDDHDVVRVLLAQLWPDPPGPMVHRITARLRDDRTGILALGMADRRPHALALRRPLTANESVELAGGCLFLRIMYRLPFR
jgi:hypothetical protein